LSARESVDSLTSKVAARYAAKNHYRYDRSKLRRLNDRDAQQKSKETFGGYEQFRIEIVPIRDINVPKVARSLEGLQDDKPRDPISLSRKGSGKWEISDGIHRTNVSIEMGYTHIPAFVAEWIRTPDEFIPNR